MSSGNAAIRAGALKGARRLRLVYEQPQFHSPITLIVGSGQIIQRRATISIKGLAAYDVADWLDLPLNAVSMQLQLALDRYLTTAHDRAVDEADEDQANALSRGIEVKFATMGGRMPAGVSVELSLVPPPAQATSSYPVGVP